MATRNLFVRAGFDASGMSSGTRQANNALRQFGKNANKQMSSLSNTISSSMGKIGKLLAGAFAVGAIINFGKEATKAFSDSSIASAKLEKVMKNTMDATSEHIESIKKLMADQEIGGVIGADVQFAGAQELGTYLTEAESLKKIIPIMNDMAAQQFGLEATAESVTNIATMLGKVMNGQVGALSRYGYSFTKAQEKILKFGTEAERAAVLVEVVGDSVGGMNAALLQTPAGQIRQLQFALDGVKSAIGEGIMSAVQAALPALNAMAKVLLKVAQAFSAFMQAIFGKTIKMQDTQISGTQDQVSAVESLGDAADDAGESAKKAGKKAKNAIMGFDEVNQLSKSSDSKSGSDGGSGLDNMDGAVSVDLGSVDDTAITEKIEGIATTIKEIFSKFGTISFEPLTEGLSRLKEALAPITETLFAGLKWGIDNVIFPLTKWTIESLVPAFLDLLSGALKVLNPLLESFKPLASFLWNNFLQPIASWTGGAIVGILEGIAKGLKAVGDWMSEHQELVTAITTTLGLFFGAWKIVELLAFIEMSGGVTKAISNISKMFKLGLGAKIADKVQTMILTALYAKDFVVALASSTAALVKQAAQFVISKGAIVAAKIAQVALTVATLAWNGICAIAAGVTTAFGAAVAFLTSPIGLVILAIAALVAGIILLIKNWDTVKAAGVKCWELIKQAWNKAGEWFNTNVVQPVAKFFNELWDGIKQAASNAWTNICNAWQSAGEWFGTNIIEPIKSKFTEWKTDISNLGAEAWSGVKTGWNNATQWFDTTIITPITKAFSTLWGGIKSSAKTAFDSVGTSAKNGMNWVIDHINNMVGKINSKLSFNLPEFFGGGKVGFSIPKIPKLAKGGVIDNPTIAMVGEAGREAVVPLENNTGWTNEVASLLANALMPFMGVGNNGNSGQNVSLEMDGTTFARTATPYVIKEMKRLGFDF